MDAQTLGEIADSAAAEFGLTLEASAIAELEKCIPTINSRGFADKTAERAAVETALQDMFADASAIVGSHELDGNDIQAIFGELCPLPPFC